MPTVFEVNQVLDCLPMIDTMRLGMQAYTGELSRQFGWGVGYGAAFLSVDEQRQGRVSAEEAAAGLQMTLPLLESAATICRGGHGEAAWKRRRKLIAEWDEWRRAFPLSVRPSFERSSPWDVLAFLEHWRAGHGGRRAGERDLRGDDGGHLVPADVAPGTLRATASNLSRIFEGVGRDGAWSASRPGGNPAAHALVKLYLKGYDAYAFHENDYSSSGAVPVDLAQHGALMRHLLARAASATDSCAKALILRDACAFAYLWETGQRGKEGCRLRTADFCYDDKLCSSLWGDIVAGAIPADRRVLVECSAGTKTRQTRHPGALELAPGLAGHPGCSMREVLPAYVRAVQASGQELAQWLFPPCNASRDGLETEHAISSGALNRRFQMHLQQIGRWHGESLHGIRRGSTQHAYAAGDQDIQTLARKRLWAQTESLEDYLHETRHRRRLTTTAERAQGARAPEASAPGRRLCARKAGLFCSRGSLGNRG